MIAAWRAGVGRLLTAAQMALVVMPWNVALWWQIRSEGMNLAAQQEVTARFPITFTNQASNDSVLFALVPNDVDRAKLQSRIMSLPR